MGWIGALYNYAISPLSCPGTSIRNTAKAGGGRDKVVEVVVGRWLGGVGGYQKQGRAHWAGQFARRPAHPDLADCRQAAGPPLEHL